MNVRKITVNLFAGFMMLCCVFILLAMTFKWCVGDITTKDKFRSFQWETTDAAIKDAGENDQ